MSATAKKPRPTAQARTISMFTGMADVDDREPGRARDGTRSEMPRRQPGPKPLKWEGGISRWYVLDGPRGESYVIEKDVHGYHAAFYAEKLGRFPDIITAGDACEAHHVER